MLVPSQQKPIQLPVCKFITTHAPSCLQAWDASNGTWPGVRPLYHSTISQLGLIKQPGVPSLVDYLLPEKGAHRHSHDLLTELLVDPPSHRVADHIRQVLRIMGGYCLLLLLLARVLYQFTSYLVSASGH